MGFRVLGLGSCPVPEKLSPEQGKLAPDPNLTLGFGYFPGCPVPTSPAYPEYIVTGMVRLRIRVMVRYRRMKRPSLGVRLRFILVNIVTA